MEEFLASVSTFLGLFNFAGLSGLLDDYVAEKTAPVGTLKTILSVLSAFSA